MRIGFHISIAGSLDLAVDRAVEMGINTFQIFTRNPRGWHPKPLDPEAVNLFKEKLEKVNIDPVFAHMPYLPNLASPKRDVYTHSVHALSTELNRCHQLGVPFLVTHLGSHLGLGKTGGFRRIVKAINHAFLEAGGEVILLLENTAGTANSMGSSFEDIRKIMDGISSNERVGICFDTCHAFSAGYDLNGRETVEKIIARFDSVLGLKRLKLVHLNDSVGDLRSHIDRHEHIGLGKLGVEGFRAILNSEFGRCPMIMETPIDERRSDLENLLKVRALVKQ